MRFYPLTSAGRKMHTRCLPIYCSLLDHLTFLMQTLRTKIDPLKTLLIIIIIRRIRIIIIKMAIGVSINT